MQSSFVTVFLNSRFLSLERQMKICIISRYEKKTPQTLKFMKQIYMYQLEH